MSLIGYVIGTQMQKTIKVRVPKEVYLPKYKKSIIRHMNYLAHDETGNCLVGDVVKIVRTPRFSRMKTHAVADVVKKADRYVDEATGYVYTNGHLHIPVGYVDKQGKVNNLIPQEMYREMGLK